MLLHDPKAVTQSLNNVNEIIHLITVWLLGIQVNYAAPIGGMLLGPALVRHLVLCCSGDHMGLCEVGKFVKCGKKGCRRCDTTST